MVVRGGQGVLGGTSLVVLSPSKSRTSPDPSDRRFGEPGPQSNWSLPCPQLGTPTPVRPDKGPGPLPSVPTSDRVQRTGTESRESEGPEARVEFRLRLDGGFDGDVLLLGLLSVSLGSGRRFVVFFRFFAFSDPRGHEVRHRSYHRRGNLCNSDLALTVRDLTRKRGTDTPGCTVLDREIGDGTGPRNVLSGSRTPATWSCS